MVWYPISLSMSRYQPYENDPGLIIRESEQPELQAYLTPHLNEDDGSRLFRVGDLRRMMSGFSDDALLVVKPVTGNEVPIKLPSELFDGRIQIDWDFGVLNVDGGREARLPSKEAELLGRFASSLNTIVTYRALAQGVWGIDINKAATRNINVHVHRLRKKLEPFNNHLVTKPKVGYGLYENLPVPFFTD